MDPYSLDIIPDEILEAIIILSGDTSLTLSDILARRAVSPRWRRLIDQGIMTLTFRPGAFRASLEGPRGQVLLPRRLKLHMHIGTRVVGFANLVKALYSLVSPVLCCLNIAVCPQSLPILCLPHPDLLQLVIAPLPNSQDRGEEDQIYAEWIPQPETVQTTETTQTASTTQIVPRVRPIISTPWLPNLCSLHLNKAYITIITALSVTPVLPALTELCVNFAPGQLEWVIKPFGTILTRLAGSLQTLCIEAHVMREPPRRPQTINLINLTELSLIITGEYPLPFNLATPQLQKLVDGYYTGARRHQSGLDTVKILVNCDLDIDCSSYNTFTILEEIHIDGMHLELVKDYFVKNRGACRFLKKIVYTGDTASVITWKRSENDANTITICCISEEEYSCWNAFTVQKWACDGCDVCLRQKRKDH